MKTVGVRETADGTGQYLECDGWSPWEYHLPEGEFERYFQATNALMMKLERMPPAVRGRLEQIEIRCPAKGCHLASLYWIPRRPTAEEVEHHLRLRRIRDPQGRQIYSSPVPRAGDYLYVGRTSSGTEVYDLLHFGFEPTEKDEARGCTCCRILYWRAGCRHGTATIDRVAILDMFSVARRALGPMQTEEQEVASLPAHLRKSWGRRVFHPAPQAWHPRKRRRADSHGQDHCYPR
jgi:hypothetical protein